MALNYALQGLLEAFHHGAFDVIILAGDEVYVPRPGQSLEGCCMHFSALVALHGQLVYHLVHNGLHGGRHLCASLAGQSSYPGVLREYVYAAEKIPSAVVGL